MKIQPECVPCLLKRVLFETKLSTKDTTQQAAVLRSACSVLSKTYDPAECSATIATKVHHAVYKKLKNNDPYHLLKKTSNTIANSLLPAAEQLIETSPDRLKTSMLCSILGNVMDFGIDGAYSSPETLRECFYELYKNGLGHDDYSEVKNILAHAASVVVFTDNCGEIVFDKILCRELKRCYPSLRITVVVKGKPILNDATLDDAEALTIKEVADEILTTGCFAVGINFQKLPKEVTHVLSEADLIIAKGMANYESFSETQFRPIVYLLRTKCSAIARSMNLSQNMSVLKLYM